jgi:hypothetical protein
MSAVPPERAATRARFRMAPKRPDEGRRERRAMANDGLLHAHGAWRGCHGHVDVARCARSPARPARLAKAKKSGHGKPDGCLQCGVDPDRIRTLLLRVGDAAALGKPPPHRCWDRPTTSVPAAHSCWQAQFLNVLVSPKKYVRAYSVMKFRGDLQRCLQTGAGRANAHMHSFAFRVDLLDHEAEPDQLAHDPGSSTAGRVQGDDLG